MIGIDITKVSRFREMSKLERLIKKLDVDGSTPLAAAKTWACLEAIIKANGKSFDYSKVKIKFPYNSHPVIVDQESILTDNYMLSLSHEDDLVVAVAIKMPKPFKE